MKTLYRRAWVLWVVLTLASGIAVAQNAPFPISGGGELDTAFLENTSARSTGKADFSYASYLGDSQDGYGWCYPGQVCDGSALVGDAVSTYIYFSQPPIARSKGCLKGVCGAKGYGGGVSGMLNVSYQFSFITPYKDHTESVDFRVPISVSGFVYGIGINSQILWTVNINGTGTAELGGFIDPDRLSITNIKLSYTGTGTVQ